jgi:hypothetical protein
MSQCDCFNLYPGCTDWSPSIEPAVDEIWRAEYNQRAADYASIDTNTDKTKALERAYKKLEHQLGDTIEDVNFELSHTGTRAYADEQIKDKLDSLPRPHAGHE